jgi:zinc transport system substrate-binding protein
MRKQLITFVILAFIAGSCKSPSGKSGDRTVTVTIPPVAWFVEAIAGDDFKVNVMLPPGADHHIWEPLPAQINSLSGSEALIVNGQLGFEEAWMKRFLQVNPDISILDLSRNIDLISIEANAEEAGHDHKGLMHQGTDPHFWMSPAEAAIMAEEISGFLTGLNPDSSEKYEARYRSLADSISVLDSLVRMAVGSMNNRVVLIYHPALAYMARDYGFEQVSFEDEGKSPSPARMKELIDLAREKEIKIIFIQAEYDVRNAEALAKESGAELVVINPLNREWPAAVIEVAEALEQGARSKDLP